MLDLEELKKKTQRILALAKQMDEAFGYGHAEDHLNLAIMAGLNDAMREGFHKAEDSREG